MWEQSFGGPLNSSPFFDPDIFDLECQFSRGTFDIREHRFGWGFSHQRIVDLYISFLSIPIPLSLTRSESQNLNIWRTIDIWWLLFAHFTCRNSIHHRKANHAFLRRFTPFHAAEIGIGKAHFISNYGYPNNWKSTGCIAFSHISIQGVACAFKISVVLLGPSRTPGSSFFPDESRAGIYFSFLNPRPSF